MKILFKYPTRQRPDKFIRCISTYYKLLKGEDHQFVVAIDNDDEQMKNPAIVSFMASLPNLSIKSGDNKTKVEAINADIPKDGWDILVLVSDDMFPEIEGFDEVIRLDMSRFYPDTDGVLWYYDGWRRDLNTLCILGKKYYDRFGYIYHPSYKSFWCDNEFTAVANLLGRQTFIDRVIIRHLHPDIVRVDESTRLKFASVFPELARRGSSGHDELFRRNDALFNVDKAVYDFRMSYNFDVDLSSKPKALK